MKTIAQVQTGFSENVKLVQRLIDFDHVVLDTAVQNLGSLQRELDARNPSVANRIGNTLDALTNLRLNDSMRRHYSAIYNQCIVLIVSHFSSALRDLFVAAAPSQIGCVETAEGLREELKFTLGELRDLNFSLRENIGEVLLRKGNISFQDMKSTLRAFTGYLGLEPLAGRVLNNIIVAQAARHAIVHNGALVDARMISQIVKATDRDLLRTVREDDEIVFDPGEIKIASDSMSEFLRHLCAQLH